MGGFSLDPTVLEQAAGRLSQLQKHTADIMALAADANPGQETWGLVGIPFEAMYHSTADELYRHFEQLGTALRDHATALDNTKMSYEATEKAISDSLKKLHEALG